MNGNLGVCIFDTGIDATHPEFENRVKAFKDFVNSKDLPYDDNGHGTHVTGIIAGKTVGIATDVSIISCKVLNEHAVGKRHNICRATEWVLENALKYNIRVVNISIGARLSNDANNEKVLLECVEKLWDKGVIVICSAGNNGPGPGTITTPGISNKVITIGSLDDKMYIDDKKIIHRDYSGRGATRNCIIKPDFLANGHNVLSAMPQGKYAVKSGTSMAAPKVAGIVARMLQKEDKMTPREVKIKLKEMAIHLNMPANRQGFGLLELSKCIDKL